MNICSFRAAVPPKGMARFGPMTAGTGFGNVSRSTITSNGFDFLKGQQQRNLSKKKANRQNKETVHQELEANMRTIGVSELDELGGTNRMIPTLELIPHIKDHRAWKKTNLDMGRHTLVTAQGRVFSFSALVLLGNYQGSGGLGYGKALSVGKAIENATTDALKRVRTIYRFENRTIPWNLKVHVNGTIMELKRKPINRGPTANIQMVRLLEMFGFKDVALKIYGRNHIRHTYMCFFKLMDLIWSPVELARHTGRKYVNKNKIVRSDQYYQEKARYEQVLQESFVPLEWQ